MSFHDDYFTTYLETSICVNCLKDEATVWCGHVKFRSGIGISTASAGWCEECAKNIPNLILKDGFVRNWDDALTELQKNIDEEMKKLERGL